jgi:hypothetical protein
MLAKTYTRRLRVISSEFKAFGENQRVWSTSSVYAAIICGINAPHLFLTSLLSPLKVKLPSCCHVTSQLILSTISSINNVTKGPST